MKTIDFKFFATLSLICTIAFVSFSSQAINTNACTIEMLDNCPTANFSVGKNNVPAGTPINFINQSTGADSYVWDFGDGNTSAAENPTHVYELPGTYEVRLSATFGGCTVEFMGTEDLIQF